MNHTELELRALVAKNAELMNRLLDTLNPLLKVPVEYRPRPCTQQVTFPKRTGGYWVLWAEVNNKGVVLRLSDVSGFLLRTAVWEFLDETPDWSRGEMP